ncbi:hypothetical protein EVAR_61985_1 [Eumeta japonica]|uniref:Uncharacterized protein n=1 Tax=Eumeta variegata TaxID=151549 RepID=A0A4C1YEP1_EUMVA|nr:hypothetical protein EVAR_61985_1 [Eumeta japonica]
MICTRENLMIKALRKSIDTCALYFNAHKSTEGETERRYRGGRVMRKVEVEGRRESLNEGNPRGPAGLRGRGVRALPTSAARGRRAVPSVSPPTVHTGARGTTSFSASTSIHADGRAIHARAVFN